MFNEDDLLPISALQHYIYCDRQAALIHLERVWLDNSFTVEGDYLHRVVDSMQPEDGGHLRVRRSVAIHSGRLGLTGKADVIEFHLSEELNSGVRLEGDENIWKIVPVEYKRGSPKTHRADEVQLCAQAMCLEELFRTQIPEGFLYYGTTKRRQRVPFNSDLRELTEATTRDLHALIASRRTPIRRWETKCRHCSLQPVCLPPRRNRPKSVLAYLDSVFGGAASVPESL